MYALPELSKPPSVEQLEYLSWRKSAKTTAPVKIKQNFSHIVKAAENNRSFNIQL